MPILYHRMLFYCFFFLSLVGKLALMAKWKLEVVCMGHDARDVRGRLTCLFLIARVLGKPGAFVTSVLCLLQLLYMK